MLAQWHVKATAPKQDFPQLRWREKLHAKQGFALSEQPTSKKMGLTARRCHDSGSLIVQATTGDLFKPRPSHILPRILRGTHQIESDGHTANETYGTDGRAF